MRNESENYIKILFSNCLSSLADALADRLFPEGSSPFEQRLVIIPNDLIKDFLNNYLAKKLGITAGVQFCGLERGVSQLLEHANKARVPSHLELTMRIQEGICFCLESNALRRFSLFAPLCEYVEGHRMQNDRIILLSQQLARLFVRYGSHGGAFLSEWLSKEGWQQWLWKRIFSNKEILSLDALRQMDAHGLFGISAHVFGFSYLPPAYLSFFAKPSATFYQFSPCAQYWDDLCSEKERLFIQRRLRNRNASAALQAEMHGLVQDHHPLLSNWGKLGREFLKDLDAYPLDIEELYEPSPPSTLPSTLLGAVKNSMLFLEGLETKVSKDDSIQIHNAPTKLREVEVLRDVLCTLLSRHASDSFPLQPQDILVLTPDIAAYASYIRMVFGNTPYAYQIDGLPHGSTSDFCQAFSYLLSLCELEWSLVNLIKLFSFDSFRKRWGFKEEDVQLIHSWLKNAEVRVGEKSWQQGIDRLCFGFAIAPEREENRVYPVACIAESDMELFNQFLICCRAVQKDVSQMRSAQRKTLAEWLEWVREIAQRHCECDEENEPVLKQLYGLQVQTSSIVGDCFSFASIRGIIHHIHERPTGILPAEHLQHIRFSSMHSGAVRPARIIYLLGLDEEHFPRFEPSLSLCALSGHTYLPLKGDEDRYLFLEALCNAQDYFILSYERIHPQDNKPQGPSYLIQELIAFARKANAELLCMDHPLLPFDAMYFADDAPVQNFDPADFLLAKAYYSRDEEKRSFFTKCKDEQKNEAEEQIWISALRKLAKNPIQFYFNESLGMYIKQDDGEVDERFCLSSLRKFSLKRACLDTTLEKVVKDSDRQGHLPEGLFKQAALNILSLEVAENLVHFEKLHVDAKECFSIEFSIHCQTPLHLENGNWILPAISLDLGEKGTCYVAGILERAHGQGLLSHGKKDLESLIAEWPLYLIYGHAGRTVGSFSERILCTKDGAIVDISLNDPIALLKDYIRYYCLARCSLSPLLPKWASSLLLKGEQEFEKAVRTMMSSQSPAYIDPYLEWMKRSRIDMDTKEMYRDWSSYLKECFSPLLDRVGHGN